MTTDPDILAVMARFRDDVIEASARATRDLVELGVEPEAYLVGPRRARYLAAAARDDGRSLNDLPAIPLSGEEQIALQVLGRLVERGVIGPDISAG